jgi:hypothetical protein
VSGFVEFALHAHFESLGDALTCAVTNCLNRCAMAVADLVAKTQPEDQGGLL